MPDLMLLLFHFQFLLSDFPSTTKRKFIGKNIIIIIIIIIIIRVLRNISCGIKAAGA